MRIMIVGAAGKAGRAVHQHLAGLGHEIAAGEVPYATVDELGSADYQAAFSQKALAQINIVRTGLAHVAERGSFTLISGIPSRDPVVSSAAAAMGNGAIEAFVRAAADVVRAYRKAVEGAATGQVITLP